MGYTYKLFIYLFIYGNPWEIHGENGKKNAEQVENRSLEQNYFMI